MRTATAMPAIRRCARVAAAAVALVAGLGAHGCVIETPPGEVTLGSFEVTASPATPTGTADAPLAFDTTAETTFDLTIRAIGTDGAPFTSYDGTAAVLVEPGRVVMVDGTPLPIVRFAGGTATTQVTVTLVSGRAAIWIQDANPGPLVPLDVDSSPPVLAGSGDPMPADAIRCGADTGFDDLPDFFCPGGTFCLRDVMCGALNATQAIGVVDPLLWFQSPTISDVQFPLSSDDSPFLGMTVTIDDRRCTAATDGLCLVVVAVSSDGFYVTDISEPAGSYNSVFAFNFSQPEDLSIGDVLRVFGGGVSEFVGFTELTFPHFTVKEAGHLELVPAPFDLDDALLSSNANMEAHESELVSMTNAYSPDTFVDCDINGDGLVALCFFFDPCPVGSNDDLEDQCAFDCQNQPGCSELTGFLTYGQWNLTLVADGGKANVVTSGVLPDFDPTATCNPGTYVNCSVALDRIVGTVRQVTPARPRWVIEPRIPSDVCFAGDPC